MKSLSRIGAGQLALLVGGLSLLFGARTLAVDHDDANRKADDRRQEECGEGGHQRAVAPGPPQRAHRERIAVHRDRFINQPAADVLGKVEGALVALGPVGCQRAGADGFKRRRALAD